MFIIFTHTKHTLSRVNSPYIDIGRKYVKKGWKKVEPYYNEYWSAEYVQIFIGFTLCFFGGTFAMTIG